MDAERVIAEALAHQPVGTPTPRHILKALADHGLSVVPSENVLTAEEARELLETAWSINRRIAVGLELAAKLRRIEGVREVPSVGEGQEQAEAGFRTAFIKNIGPRRWLLWIDEHDPIEVASVGVGQPEEVAQRQDSLDDQLKDVAAAATRMGCYDAADWIRARRLRNA